MNRYDTVVIGAGTAGLVTACRLAQANKKVLLVANGVGALVLASGCIDVLGFHPAGSSQPADNPLEALNDFLADNQEHPYAVVGKENVAAGLEAFRQIVDGTLEYSGAINRNWLLPSAAGAIHPNCLAPKSLTNGDLRKTGNMLVVGFHELRDFYPALISQNLNAQNLGVQTDSLIIDAPPPVAGNANVTPIELARAFDQPEFRQHVVRAVKKQASRYNRIGFPAVLGLTHHAEVLADLEERLGKSVFEISTLPPSVPGRRLFEALQTAFVQANGRLIIGSKVVDGIIENGRVTQIRFETSNRLRTIKADNYVLATGGIFGGGIQTDADGRVWEPIFGLPIVTDEDRHQWFTKNFLDPNGQPVADYGIKVNGKLNPVDGNNAPIASNLYIAGALLAQSNWIPGRTGDGIALATSATIVKELS